MTRLDKMAVSWISRIAARWMLGLTCGNLKSGIIVFGGGCEPGSVQEVR